MLESKTEVKAEHSFEKKIKEWFSCPKNQPLEIAKILQKRAPIKTIKGATKQSLNTHPHQSLINITPIILHSMISIIITLYASYLSTPA